jgi:capsular polysaccharide transport system permease protein
MSFQRLIEGQGRSGGLVARLGGARVLKVFSYLTAVNTAARRRLGLLGYSFILCVCLPTLVALAYHLLVASPEYESEARFAVKGASENRSSAITDALSSLGSVIGVRSTAQDSFIVTEYIRSRTIIEDLGGKSVVEAIYSKPEVDWFSRLRSGEPLEDVWEYWRDKVTALIDTQSNVITLRVRAFTPAEAKALADDIVRQSEILVNRISERTRQDALARAEAEVQLAMQKLAKLRAAMLEFRNQASTIDPVSSAASLGETLTALSREKIALEANREVMRGVMNENAPTLRHLSTQIDAIDQQIKLLQERLTSRSKDEAAMSSHLATYEDLQLQSQFAEKLLTIAQAAYEKARAEQDKQQLYLVNIVRPTMPEEESYPKPFVSALIVFALCLMVWSMVTLVIASIEDHVG